ncbi:hypothetical protein [Natrinema halophilum]|uniref:hypothetical protein n=1 Tax=Natrinema halophilum TaxID=1699371 RepID=UPI001F2150C4|nr:hypothetical protein [Natrinema halophilum]UHQ96481.1 hypothetical protein HYG82_23450 [Natrinema halophilum]
MTYHYECDGFCEPQTIYRTRPALTAEFNEQFFESTRIGGQLAEHEFEVGDLITLCPECTRRLLIDFP